jgi:hypothetical protein
MWRKLQWQLLQQLLLSHPSMTLLRVSGTSPSVHSVLLLLRNRQQLPVVLEAIRRGSISGMGQLLTGRDQSTGRLQRYSIHLPVIVSMCCKACDNMLAV